MSVRSQALYNGQVEEVQPQPPTHRPLGLVLIVFGVLWWLPAARTTVDGWVIMLNTVAEFFELPGRLGRPNGWLLLGLAIGVGLVYSRVEIHESPIKYRGGHIFIAGLMAWIGWLFLASTDVGSTFLGIVTLPVDPWPIHRQLASITWLSFSLALLSTYAPDLIIYAGYRLIRGR
jgi:hypothetical protein